MCLLPGALGPGPWLRFTGVRAGKIFRRYISAYVQMRRPRPGEVEMTCPESHSELQASVCIYAPEHYALQMVGAHRCLLLRPEGAGHSHKERALEPRPQAACIPSRGPGFGRWPAGTASAHSR